MRKAVPVTTSLAVFLAYAGWTVIHPDASPAGGWGLVVDPLRDRIRDFFSGGSVWMGASYALSAGFTAFALSVFRENRRRAAVGAAGGVVVAGAVYGFGCFVLGCCGSPMLPIYIGLLGAKWANLSGPLMFGLTLASVALGVLLLRRKRGCGCEGTYEGSGNG